MRLALLFLVGLTVLANGLSVQASETHSSIFNVHSESEVLVRRGAGVVTQADFDVFMNRLPRHHRSEFLADPDRIADALERLMLPRQIVARAREEGFLDEPDRQHQMAQVLTVYLADEALEQKWEEVRLDDYTQQARELYLTRPDLLRSRRLVDFTHILISSGAQRGDLDAMRLILSIYDRLEDGYDLADLAAEYSEDPTVGENRGRFEGVELHTLDERFGQVARFLEPGQISEPFQSSFGWHIVQLHDRYRTEADGFESVRDRALEMAERRHRESWRESFMAGLTSEPVEFAPGAIAALRQRYEATDQDRDEIAREVLRRMGLD